MKKTIVASLLILSFLLCLVSCDLTSGNSSSTTSKVSPEPEPAESVYDLLNRLSGEAYSKIVLTVTVGTGEDELTSTYTIAENKVVYRIERLAELTVESELPNDRIIVREGTATVQNGRVTEIDGKTVKLPDGNALTGKNFHFEEADFLDVTESPGGFSAKVKNPGEWLGSDKVITDLTVEVKYSDTGISTIRLEYDLSGTPVQTEYRFE